MRVHRYAALLFAALLVVRVEWTKADDATPQAAGDEDYSAELPRIPPRSPAESLKTFRIHSGFRIELAAAEPQVTSPVALDFDEDGKIYVVEFRDFNQNSSKVPQGPGRV